MTDSSNEAKECKIPAVIISKAHAARIDQYLDRKKEEPLITSIHARKLKDCIVCQDVFEIGQVWKHIYSKS
jgi:hypothetical protein